MQVSNLLWIRKEYGVSPYLFLIFHYATLAVAFYAWKITVNIINFRNPFFQLRSQVSYSSNNLPNSRCSCSSILLREVLRECKCVVRNTKQPNRSRRNSSVYLCAACVQPGCYVYNALPTARYIYPTSKAISSAAATKGFLSVIPMFSFG